MSNGYWNAGNVNRQEKNECDCEIHIEIRVNRIQNTFQYISISYNISNSYHKSINYSTQQQISVRILQRNMQKNKYKDIYIKRY